MRLSPPKLHLNKVLAIQRYQVPNFSSETFGKGELIAVIGCQTKTKRMKQNEQTNEKKDRVTGSTIINRMFNSMY
jgi:hypothetical protein